MSSNRMEILKSMLAQNPADTFARYGLAMEYTNRGELLLISCVSGSLSCFWLSSEKE